MTNILLYMTAIASLVASAVAVAGPIGFKFSLDPASPSISGGITPDDLLISGPAIHTDGKKLDLQNDFLGGVFDNLADFSFGKDPIRNPLFFSVDRVAVGLPGSAVFSQALPGPESAAGDVYVALPPFRSNRLVINETGLGLKPGFFGDDLDALDDDEPTPRVFFTIDRLSATNGFGAGDLSNDILVSARNDSFGVYKDHATIGLRLGDAIDGLVLDFASEIALFSLDPFSPSTFTFTGLDYSPCVPGRMSPADVCITFFNRSYSGWAGAEDLGLRRDDNVDALDTTPAALLPEPGTLLLLGASLVGLWAVRTRRVALTPTSS